uniref:Uncharacterized protein n=1 Tax=Eutreptiella gymnastica TaxID=73025 RepID=A0A7S4CUV2_9EUGL
MRSGDPLIYVLTSGPTAFVHLDSNWQSTGQPKQPPIFFVALFEQESPTYRQHLWVACGLLQTKPCPESNEPRLLLYFPIILPCLLASPRLALTAPQKGCVWCM